MKCLGTVLLSILGVCVAFVAIGAIVGALIWLSEASSRLFGLDSVGASAAFMVGYMAIGIGIALGVTICREQRA